MTWQSRLVISKGRGIGEAGFNLAAIPGADAVGGDHPVADGNDAVGVLGDVRLVGDENDGVALSVEVVKQTHDFVAGAGVEVAGGLVGEDDAGMIDEGARNGDALALSAGEFVGFVHHAGAEVYGFEDFFCTASALGGRGAVVDEGKLDVVEGSGAGEKVEGLKDKANFLIADAGKFVIVQLGNIVAVEPVFAFGGGVQTADEIHQRGFAGTGRTHDCYIFVVADAEVDAA